MLSHLTTSELFKVRDCMEILGTIFGIKVGLVTVGELAQQVQEEIKKLNETEVDLHK